MAIMEIQIVPVGTGSPSIHDMVAACVRVARDADVDVQVTPTGSVLEGAVDRLFRVAEKMHQEALKRGAPRVFTSITVDERKTGEVGLKKRVQEVEDAIGRNS